MTEFDERLTHEYSTLAAQYAQEQQQLSGQVARLEAHVRHLVDQQGRRSAAVYRVEQNLGGTGRALGHASAALGRSERLRSAGLRQVEQVHGRTARNLERTCRESDQGIQRTRAAFGRGLKAVRAAVEHTRTRPHGLPDRVQGLIENLIARSRNRGGPSR